MTINTIKAQIQRLAEEHHAIDEVNLEDLKDTESLELDAEVLIKEYCEKQGYQVQGFPHEKRKINDEEFDDEYSKILAKMSIGETSFSLASNTFIKNFKDK